MDEPVKCPDCDGRGVVCLGYDDDGYAVLEQCRRCYEEELAKIKEIDQ